MIEESGQSDPDVLRRTLLEAFEQLQTAHATYQDALATAIDTDLSSDGMFAIREQGRLYASAVKRYSDAVMAWLIIVETNRERALELLRKTKTHGA
jgi:hypothetical protein